MKTTTLAVEHANCPDCLHETLDDLRRVHGIRAVVGSMAGSGASPTTRGAQ